VQIARPRQFVVSAYFRMATRVLSVSVDLDEMELYHTLYGLSASTAGDQLYARAVPRLSDWAKQRAIPLTWFVVGKDLRLAANAEAVARLARSGDELGSHSYSHFYDLVRRSAGEMRHEIEAGVTVLERASGAKVQGFRAPGYTVNDTLLALLHEAGVSYDSSVFPCPAYYALKVAAIARMAARGKQSQAIIGAPDALRAPTTPYRVGNPYWFRGTGMWEIPIQVTHGARLPFIGTSLTMAGAMGARLLARGVVGEPFVNLELHGIDALDQSDGLTELAKHQRDLRIPWPKKLDAIDAAVTLLRQRGYACVRMDELAQRARAQ
jgi:peptidoglycan/xylan/chitin deacetylase (PgdA/CDA1 family)